MGCCKSQAVPIIGDSALSAKVSVRYHRPPRKLADDYAVEDVVLGTGCNGSVYRAKSIYDAEGVFAIKGFKASDLSSSERAQLKDEVEIFLSMDHPHVARLVDCYEDTDSDMLHLVMECQSGGELLDRVQAKGKFSEVDAAHAIWQILLAVNYVHARGIVHRDIKLENFLYEKKDSDYLKLIDFGFSKLSDKNKVMKGDAAGTIEYAAPEVFDFKFTSKCDLWSVGIIAFILLLDYMPFSGDNLEGKISSGKYTRDEKKWKALSDVAANFIESLLVVQFQKRADASGALKHPFIAKRDQSARRYITPFASLDSQTSQKLNVSDEIIGALCSFAKASQFRRECLSLMAWSLTEAERSEVRDAFIELDIRREGVIRLQQLKGHLVTTQDIGDEELHYSDFLGAMVSKSIAVNDDHVISTFRRFDKDKSGTISLENLEKILGRVFDPGQCKQIVHAVDAGSSEMSYDKFLVYLKGSDKQGSTPPPANDAKANRRLVTVPASKLAALKVDDDDEEEDGEGQATGSKTAV